MDKVKDDGKGGGKGGSKGGGKGGGKGDKDQKSGFFPHPAPIEAYGKGGFRFAGMSHIGAILVLPSGIHAWDVGGAQNAEKLTNAMFDQVFSAFDEIDFLILGTGVTQTFPSAEVMRAFSSRNIGLDFMDTGAAIPTFNILLGEGRAVGAGLLPVA